MEEPDGMVYLELPEALRRFTHEELLVYTESMSPARLLGKGGFGPVYLARDSSLDRNLAVKVGTNADEAGVGQGRNEFENEALLLWLWQHERIVRLEGVSIGNVPSLIYEHMAGGSLASLLSNPARAATFSAKQRLTVAADVAHAMAYLHEGGCGAEPPENPRVRHAVVLHRDVNSSNVLLDEDLRGKLGDFGLCVMIHQADIHAGMVLSGNQLIGQWAWTAPEAQELGNMTASDVYALGLIILQLLSGCEDSDLPALRMSVAQPGIAPVTDPRLAPHLNWPPAVAETMFETGLRCSEAAPSARPRAAEVLGVLVSCLTLLDVTYTIAPPRAQEMPQSSRTQRFEPRRFNHSGTVSTLLRFSPHKSRAEREAGTAGGMRRAAGITNHERKPSLEAGVLRLYRWEGPGGRDATPDKQRQAAIVSVVAVVCCSEQVAQAMLEHCGWDVTHAVERFLTGHPAPAPRAAFTLPPPPPRLALRPPPQQLLTPGHAASGAVGIAGAAGVAGVAGAAGAGRRGGGDADGGGGGGGGEGGGAVRDASEVGMVRLPPGTATGRGRVQFADGSSFTGSWVNGVVQGHGHFACGDKEYTGEFLNGRMHGQGVHRWTNPALIEYDGSWHQGLMHGSGIVTKGPERRRYDCAFESGRVTRQKALTHACKLNEEERSFLVSTFCSVLQESTAAEAQTCLSQYDWNLQSAIKAALDGNPARALFDGEPLQGNSEEPAAAASVAGAADVAGVAGAADVPLQVRPAEEAHLPEPHQSQSHQPPQSVTPHPHPRQPPQATAEALSVRANLSLSQASTAGAGAVAAAAVAAAGSVAAAAAVSGGVGGGGVAGSMAATAAVGVLAAAAAAAAAGSGSSGSGSGSGDTEHQKKAAAAAAAAATLMMCSAEESLRQSLSQAHHTQAKASPLALNAVNTKDLPQQQAKQQQQQEEEGKEAATPQTANTATHTAEHQTANTATHTPSSTSSIAAPPAAAARPPLDQAPAATSGARTCPLSVTPPPPRL